jgi:AcrR family transcriptional regulator
MKKGNATRDTIIDEALAQAVIVGLEGLTVGTLASRLELSKSGLFAHFKSREALQLAVLQAAIDRFALRVVVPAFSDAEGRYRLRRLFLRHLDWISEGDGAGGCLFVTAAQEFDDRPGAVRDLLVRSQKEWRNVICKVVEDATKNGEFRKDTDSEQLAFELAGIALSYQLSLKLLQDQRARKLAERSFDRLERSVLLKARNEAA